MKTCKDCDFWEISHVINCGKCRYYPKSLETNENDWCGKLTINGVRQVNEKW